MVLVISCGGDSPSPITPPTDRPTPTPTSPPPPGDLACPLGDGSLNALCTQGPSSVLLEDVNIAIDRFIEQRPELFDKTSVVGPEGSTQYLILDQKAFVDGVIMNLRDAGFCAQLERDIGEFIEVKRDNGLSEEFKIILSSGHIRRGMSSYRNTCEPASFPVDPGPDAPPPGSGCGKPYPPPISRFSARVPHVRLPDYWVLDSTPLVGPDPAYCAAVGFTDGRSICPVRGPQDDERVPCETWRVGYAADTHRPGPTWRKADGSFCTGLASGCENHPENQYSLHVFVNGGAGNYTVCAENGACLEVTVAF
jgi:hypothetical protein